MTNEEIGRLFQKFSRARNQIEQDGDIEIQGTGLGLFIAKEIVELHNGKIHLDSKGRNKGSTFTVELPLN